MADSKFTDIYKKRVKRRFERDKEMTVSKPRMVLVGGRGFSFLDILPLKHKQAGGGTLDPQEQAALEKWNETA